MSCASRHWFAVGVRTGVQRPTCSRCGDPHPRWTAELQARWDEWEADRRHEQAYARRRATQSEQMREGEIAMTLFWRLAWTQLAAGRYRQALDNMDVALRVAGVPLPSGQRARRG